jgi:hypothetical protein
VSCRFCFSLPLDLIRPTNPRPRFFFPSPSPTERKAGPYSNMPPPASPLALTPSQPSAPQPTRKRRNPSASIEPSQHDERGDSESGADGDDDPNGDDKLYCVCQQKSYGEMIGCDNDNCRFEWVIEEPEPEFWVSVNGG